MPQVDINYWAVIVAAIASMITGSIWYAPPVFGKTWLKLSGKTEADWKNSGKMSMIGAMISALVMAYVLAHFVDYVQADTFSEGLQTGFWLWLGFVATTSMVNSLFQGQSKKLWILDSANHLVSLLAMAAILAIWR